MMELVVLLRAEADSQRIYNRLENFQDGRGELFLLHLDEAFLQLQNFPEIAPVFRPPYRRKLLRGFPYGVIYSLEGDRIVVLTIAPLRQDPDKLKAMLDDPHS
jgi:plasmid stabilization system protein ParE